VNGIRAVVFDGDDTLWSTEPLYDRARADCRQIVVECGLDGAQWEARERQIDVDNVATLGYSTERFPSSCVAAYEEVSRRAGCAPDQAVADRVRSAARSFFDADQLLDTGAREMLTELRQRGIRLALLTKGEPRVQQRRIDQSGLSELFDVVRVVADKSPHVIRDVVAALGATPASAWMVGNSVRSDVLPAVDAGLRAVWIDAHVWEHERTHDHLAGNHFADDRVIAVSRLSEVPELIRP